jgi:transcriptional regulator with XRE-family HTH domain
MVKEPNLRVRVMTRALRELRDQVRMTQQEAGDRLRFTNRKMSRIETGQLPTYHELLAMLDLYGVVATDWEPYIAMWERAKEKGWWHTYGESDRGYVGLENEANEVREFQLGFVPGLLQTEAYTRAACAESSHLSDQAVERVVAGRLRRQQRLIDDNPLFVHVVIDQAVLRNAAPFMHDQLAHIVMLSDLDNITIQILSSSLHEGLYGSFIVLGFPGQDSDIAYVEHVAGAIQLEKEDEVRRCRLAFDRLASRALSHEESVALIDQAAAAL